MIGKRPIATIAALARLRANQGKLTALLIPIMALCAAEAVAAPKGTRAAKTQPAAMDAARFDGRWTIEATASGMCPVSRQSMIAVIRGGRLIQLSGLSASSSGHVTSDGTFFAKFSTLGHAAQALGKLRETSGSGAWSSSSEACGGTWRAYRGGVVHAER
jgi:hypothetical protein